MVHYLGGFLAVKAFLRSKSVAILSVAHSILIVTSQLKLLSQPCILSPHLRPQTHSRNSIPRLISFPSI